MCGIAGLWKNTEAAEQRRDRIRRMLYRVSHRGPDSLGYYFDEAAALGSARLSIIDIAGGDQPISDPEGRHWIVFNGEIYNYPELRQDLEALGHTFETRSDTEALLHSWLAWQAGALEKLNGAFAFAIYDRLTGRLVLARDRYGKRPLYYRALGSGLAFASEIKCFLECDGGGLSLDDKALASIFCVWTPVAGQTAFREIRQIPAGSFLTADQNGIALRPYIVEEPVAAAPDLSEENVFAITREMLRASTRIRLRSDVEVGCYLSGGLDSAIITRLAADTCPRRLRTFSIGFANADFDESPEQRTVADALGVEHTTLTISDADIIEAFPNAIWHAEVPVFRTAFVPMYLLSKIARDSGIKVVLTGEGADEAFLGYDIFKETLLRAKWPTLDVAARKERIGQLYPHLKHFGKENTAALYSFFERSSSGAPSDLFSHDVRIQASQISVRLLKERHDGLARLREHVESSRGLFDSLSAVQKAQWLEYETLLSGYLLSTQGDRMAMAHGVENRCPFLDPQVVTWGRRLTPRYAEHPLEKYVLRRAFAELLPEQTVWRRKQPYLAPDARSFLASGSDYWRGTLSQRAIADTGVLNVDLCMRLTEKLAGREPQNISPADSQAFMSLLSTVVLHHQFVAHPPPTPSNVPPFVKQLDGRMMPAVRA